MSGQVVSLDSWNDYIAVGSTLVQLIQLNSTSEPRRIIYAKDKSPVQVYGKTLLIKSYKLILVSIHAAAFRFPLPCGLPWK